MQKASSYMLDRVLTGIVVDVCRFSFKIQKNFQKLFTDKLTPCNLKTVFTSPIRVKRFLTFNDKLQKDFAYNICL